MGQRSLIAWFIRTEKVELVDYVWRMTEMGGWLPGVIGRTIIPFPLNQVLEFASAESGVQHRFDFILQVRFPIHVDRRWRDFKAIRNGVRSKRFKKGNMENREDITKGVWEFQAESGGRHLLRNRERA